MAQLRITILTTICVLASIFAIFSLTTMLHGPISVAIPEELARKIDELVKLRKYGYRSQSQFATDAVRRRIKRIVICRY